MYIEQKNPKTADSENEHAMELCLPDDTCRPNTFVCYATDSGLTCGNVLW